MTLHHDFYIYVLFRENGSPFYIGKGRGNRINSCRYLERKNSYKRNIVRKMIGAGLDVPRVKIRSGLTEQQAFEIERAFITAIGRHPHGPLVNMTDGGEGWSGGKMSESHKAAFNRKGRKNSAVHNAAISRSALGNKRGAGHAISERQRRRASEANIRNKHSLGRKHSEQTRKLLSEKAKIRGMPRSTVEAAWRASRQKSLVRKYAAIHCGFLSQST